MGERMESSRNYCDIYIYPLVFSQLWLKSECFKGKSSKWLGNFSRKTRDTGRCLDTTTTVWIPQLYYHIIEL